MTGGGALPLLQKVGRALMLPVSVLPVAGLFLGLGSPKLGLLPPGLAEVLSQAGGAVFAALPLLFAIAVALGLSDDDGSAALAAVVGYVVLVATLGAAARLLGLPTTRVLGFESVETGVLGGILVGLLSASLSRRFAAATPPAWLGLFGGRRLVPVLAGLVSALLGALLAVLWPPLQGATRAVSDQVAYAQPVVSVFVYGLVDRLLLPLGLHHIWNVPFFFEIGSFVDGAGRTVHGDIPRFFAGDPEAGILAGGFLFKMWGLPAAALAIWRCAREESRARVGALLLAAAGTAFLTGITEPVEFTFLFLAPPLYVLHALLSGLSYAVAHLLGMRLGFTFSHGLFDLVLYWPMDTRPWLVPFLGPLWSLVYYGVFRAAILRFDLKTPGRGEPSIPPPGASAPGEEEPPPGPLPLARQVVDAFGGTWNVESLDACITRLRVTVRDLERVDEKALRTLGAAGVVVVGNAVQAVFGTRSENLKAAMEGVLEGVAPAAGAPAATELPGGRPGPEQVARVRAILPALGGAPNVRSAEPCARTRVRLTLADPSLLDETRLLASGVGGVMRLPGGVVHLVVGDEAEALAAELKSRLEPAP